MKPQVKNDYIIPVIYLTIFIFFPYYGNDYYKYLNIFIALILFFYVAKKRKVNVLLKIEYARWMTILLVLIYASLFWSENISLAVGGANIFLLTYVGQIALVWWAYDDNNKIDFILNVSIRICVLLFIKTLLVTPLNAYGDQYQFGVYTGYDKNMFSILAATMTWMATYLYYKYHKRNYIILWLIMFLMALINGSRKGVLMAVMGTPLIILLMSNKRKKVIYICIYIFLGIAAVVSVINIPFLYKVIGCRLENLCISIFTSRNNNDGSIVERRWYIELALEMFKEKKILGWGANGFSIHNENIIKKFVYSHCNYTELLCNFGIVGFMIYYLFNIKLIVKSFKGIKKKDLNAVVSFVIMSLFLIFEYGFVSYYDLEFCFIKTIVVLLLCTNMTRSPYQLHG